MKILISDSQHPNAVAPQYADYLGKQPKLTVTRFAHDDLYIQWTKRSLAHKLCARLTPKVVERNINTELIRLVSTTKPNVVWVFKGGQFFPNTIQSVKETGSLLVNLNGDHPWNFFQRGSGNANVTNSFHLYDVFFTYSRSIAAEVAKRYPEISTHVLPFGHRVTNSQYEQLTQIPESKRVCFIGNPDRLRAAFLDKIVASGIPIDVYGFKWSRHLQKKNNLRVFNQANGQKYYETLRKYRVQLNLFRPQNANSHNMRSFETPACGGVMLAPDSEEHRVFFNEGKEAFFFNSPENAIEQCRHILELPDDEILKIRDRARLRSVQSGYSYNDRAKTALQIIHQFHLQRSGKQPSP